MSYCVIFVPGYFRLLLLSWPPGEAQPRYAPPLLLSYTWRNRVKAAKRRGNVLTFLVTASRFPSVDSEKGSCMRMVIDMFQIDVIGEEIYVAGVLWSCDSANAELANSGNSSAYQNLYFYQSCSAACSLCIVCFGISYRGGPHGHRGQLG